jgi:hypothetical protein
MLVELGYEVQFRTFSHLFEVPIINPLIHDLDLTTTGLASNKINKLRQSYILLWPFPM